MTVVDRAKARGLEWPLPEEMGDAAIRAAIYPKKPKPDAAKAEVDHDRVDREMERPGAPEGGTAARPLPYRIDVASRSLQGWLPCGFA